MKTKLLLLLAMLVSGFAFSQTSVTITGDDPYYVACYGNVTTQIRFNGFTKGYAMVDSILSLDVNFGDGTSQSISITGYYFTHDTMYFDHSFTHSFVGAQKYLISGIVKAIDGKADTLKSQIILSYNCDSIKGNIYYDRNENCTFDGTDLNSGSYTIQITEGGYNMPLGYPRLDGSYSVAVPVGYTYNVTLLQAAIPGVRKGAKIVCPANAVYTTAAPAQNLDFPIGKSLDYSSMLFFTDTSYNNYFFSNHIITCDVPYKMLASFSPGTTSYPELDSLHVYFNFGDGHDTTFTMQSNTNTGFSNYSTMLSHNYTFAGDFSTQVIITASDGRADTANVTNQFSIRDTCGNLSGYVYNDANGNCVFDAGETPLYNVPLSISSNGNILAWAYTDSNGKYGFNKAFGSTYDITLNPAQALGFSGICPATGKYTVSALPSANNNFGLICSNGFDLTGNVYGFGFKPGCNGYLFIDAKNINCLPQNATAKVVLSPLVTFKSSYPASTVIGDTVIFTAQALSSLNNGFYGYVEVTTSLSAQLTDSVCGQMIISPSVGDVNASNNTINYCYQIRNSWDPNLKEVSPAGTGPSGKILPNQKMTYNIHFQNTGNDTAANIFVLDTLSNNLDLNTLSIEASSHKVATSIIEGGVLKFTFNNIMLPDSGANQAASNGYVTYTVMQKSNLPDGAQLKNTAYIYFDYNKAVITNTVVNTIDRGVVGISNIDHEKHITMYPNPANSQLFISFSQNELQADVLLMDVIGNILITSKFSNGKSELNISSIANGTYMLVLKDGNSVRREKVVVMH